MEQSIFESKSLPKAYFKFSIPVVLGLVITIIYNITDTYFISLTKNTDLVAGVSLCAPVFTLLMGFGNIFGQGGSSLISRLMGQNNKEKLAKVSSFCFYFSILLGVLLGAILLAFRTPILHLLGADSDTIAYALPYFSWFSLGSPFVILSFIHTNLLRSEGMAKDSMIASICGSVINIILDPLLIFTCGLGAAGAAIATIIGYISTDVYSFIIVKKKSKVLSVDFRKWLIEKADIAQIVGVGISAALSNITQSFCLILTNHYLLQYGNDKVAAMGIVQKVTMIVMLVIVGFSFGAAPLIGYFYGSKDHDRLSRLLKFIITFLCSTALGMSLIMILLASPLVKLFLDDTQLVETGVLMLRAQVAGMIFMAIVLFFTIIFQATGKSIPALILALSRQGVVFAIVISISVFVAGYYGIIFSQFFSDIISAALAVVLFYKYKKSL